LSVVGGLWEQLAFVPEMMPDAICAAINFQAQAPPDVEAVLAVGALEHLSRCAGQAMV